LIFLKLIDVDDFDSNLPFGFGVDSLIDFAILAFADLLVQRVVLDNLDHIE
jgi:hypothetical protein